MTPERWRQIEELYHRALEMEQSQRTAFVRDTCMGDSGLQQEVERLLAEYQRTGSFLEQPALQGAAVALAANSGQTWIGRRIRSYEIVSLLGAGGMGEVYRARDTKLQRDVAIKVLPASFAHDPQRLGRFEQEARTLAALNNSRIGAIYGFEEVGDRHALVLELVEGPTLADRLEAGPILVDEALRIARQIAEALEAAHETGIVHRDLKPANIKITPDGNVKILDFGLAKAFAGAAGSVDLTQIRTDEGMILGTPSYMSPEQARGQSIDKRTDIWAFGCVLYEMLTGKRAFAAETLSDTIVAILDREPNWNALPPRTPLIVRRLLQRCFEKEPGQRLRDIRDVRLELDHALAGNLPERNAAKARPFMSSRWLIGAAVLLAGAVAIILPRTRLNQPSAPLASEQITAFPDFATNPALSADGRMLTFTRGPGTFVTAGEIYVKVLPGGEPVQLTHDGLPKMHPMFSPDGSRIVYTVNSSFQSSWDTWVVPVIGGAARPWLPNASGLSWIGPQQLLFSEIKNGEGIHMAIVTASESRAGVRNIYVPDDIRGMAHRSYLSPDRKWVLLVEMDRSGMIPCRVVPFDGSSNGRVAGPTSGQCTIAAWSPDGRWMYFSSDATGSFQIWRQRFPDGKPEQITFGPTVAEGIAVSPDGRSLITSLGLDQRAVWLHENGADRQISTEGDALLPAWGDGFPGSVFSPDGKKLYYLVHMGSQRGFGGGELWVRDLASGSNEPLLPGLAMTTYDVSPNGDRLIFAAIGADGKSRIWLAPVDRRSPPLMLPPAEALGPVFGGENEAYFRGPEGGQWYIYRIALESGRVEKFTSDPAVNAPSVSPDGQWIVSRTTVQGREDSGVLKAYRKEGGPPVTVCKACFVSWTRDGRSLFFSFTSANSFAGKTFIITLPAGRAFPTLPPQGLNSEADLQKVSVDGVIDRPVGFPGPSASTYAFEKQFVQRNLYRIAIP